jgi:hypothetical protein
MCFLILSLIFLRVFIVLLEEGAFELGLNLIKFAGLKLIEIVLSFFAIFGFWIFVGILYFQTR